MAVPPANAGVCAGDVGSRACVGYTVLSSDCRVGAVAVNGVWIEGYLVVGEVFWEICWGGLTYSGHSYEALAVGWYDSSLNGERSCALWVPDVSVPTDCALGPPTLPVLV